MQYYIGEGTQQRGPFTIEQIRAMRIGPETLVWHEGMTQWQPARTLAELQSAPKGAGAPPTVPVATAVGYAQAPVYNPGESKKVLAGVMGILFGGLGIHKFVLGFTGAGLVLLLTTVLTCGFAGIVTHLIGLIEGIIYLSKSDAEFHQEYVVQRKTWF
jgi:TM2 domain-containing membrane protein YozV